MQLRAGGGALEPLRATACGAFRSAPPRAPPTWITTMFPTAAAACAARGEGGSPSGVTFSQRPVRTSMMLTSLVAPAKRMPVRVCRMPRRVRAGGWRRSEAGSRLPTFRHRGVPTPAQCPPHGRHTAALLPPSYLPAGLLAGPGEAGGSVPLDCPSSAVAPPAGRRQHTASHHEAAGLCAAQPALTRRSCPAPGAAQGPRSPNSTSLAELRSPSGPAMAVSVCPHLRASAQAGSERRRHATRRVGARRAPDHAHLGPGAEPTRGNGRGSVAGSGGPSSIAAAELGGAASMLAALGRRVGLRA